MGWEREYERWRDCGHTWGPGIDDAREPTDEEIAESEAWHKKYEELKASVRVEPSRFAREAGAMLEKMLSVSRDADSGALPYDWRDKYNVAKLDCAKSVAQGMGYELKLREWKDRDKNKFMISVEFYGHIPERGGNLHDFSVVNIKSVKDCTQLFADFSELGYWPTVWYKEHHISLKDSAELRLEMKRWGFPLEQDNKRSIDEQINSASSRVSGPETGDSSILQNTTFEL